MRYFKVLGLLAFFGFTVVFLMSNVTTLMQEFALMFKVFGVEYTSQAVPFYLLILLAFLLGALLATLYFFLERVRLSKKCKLFKKEVDTLERELKSSRVQPEETPSYTPDASADSIQN